MHMEKTFFSTFSEHIDTWPPFPPILANLFYTRLKISFSGLSELLNLWLLYCTLLSAQAASDNHYQSSVGLEITGMFL